MEHRLQSMLDNRNSIIELNLHQLKLAQLELITRYIVAQYNAGFVPRTHRFQHGLGKEDMLCNNLLLVMKFGQFQIISSQHHAHFLPLPLHVEFCYPFVQLSSFRLRRNCTTGVNHLRSLQHETVAPMWSGLCTITDGYRFMSGQNYRGLTRGGKIPTHHHSCTYIRTAQVNA